MSNPEPVLTLPCPAKLNLFLHIIGQREDGYHLLQTLFQLVDFGDSLSITVTDDAKLQLKANKPELETSDNLVIKAAKLLQKHSNSTYGAKFYLEKRLPMGGGVGGGSSNAATALLGLNKLWNCELSLEELAELGAGLGADIPVFVHGRSAWAEGIGERLTPMELPNLWYVILTPPCKASTPQIFSHSELTRHTSAITIAPFPILGSKNDCEQVACQLYPEIRKALNWLNQHSQARMTGTGASIFASFESEDKARKILDIAPDELEGFVARGINKSPVHEILNY